MPVEIHRLASCLEGSVGFRAGLDAVEQRKVEEWRLLGCYTMWLL
jgi:hypothetical protein